MIAIPLAIFILMAALVLMQEKHYHHIKTMTHLSDSQQDFAEYADFQKEFKDYKARVDALTVRAGFKL